MKNKIENYLIVAVIIWACFILFVIVNHVIPIHYPQSSIVETTPKIENEIVETESNIEPPVSSPDPFYELTEDERYLVESIVAGESGIEPYWGKVGVASCILNACLLEDKRPKEIQTMYGYAGWKPIEEFESECMEAYGNTDLADEVREAVSQVFDKGEVLSNEILWFYAPKYSSGKWHQTQKFVIEISNHRFYAPWN